MKHFKETRRVGDKTVHASSPIWKPEGLVFSVWEDSCPTGPHHFIGRREDFGDDFSSPWVGDITSRRWSQKDPLEQFWDNNREEALRLARQAFPEFQIDYEIGATLLCENSNEKRQS